MDAPNDCVVIESDRMWTAVYTENDLKHIFSISSAIKVFEFDIFLILKLSTDSSKHNFITSRYLISRNVW